MIRLHISMILTTRFPFKAVLIRYKKILRLLLVPQVVLLVPQLQQQVMYSAVLRIGLIMLRSAQ